MNRWLRQLETVQTFRLAPALAQPVQNVQNVRKASDRGRSEQFEGVERDQRRRRDGARPPTPSFSGDAVEQANADLNEQDNRRAWIDGLARLDPTKPPSDVPLIRWERFIVDARRFLDSEMSSSAESLGWRGTDLFGCDTNRPFARIDQAGLLWLLNGHQVVALTLETARIKTATGATQTYHRLQRATCCVVAWNLVGVAS